jgi:tripartite-type tricarboxylate transporter receptor subunit TctC
LGRAARSSPDGYTIVSVNHINYVANPVLFKSAPYELKDLSPITFAAQTTQVFAVNPSLPVQTVADIVSLIKANPGKFAYATPGFGSAGAMVGELFRHSLGLDLIQVPFNGAGPAIGSTVAGHTMIAFGSPAATVPQIKAGRLRALAVATKKRLATLPDIPTMAQAGFPDIECDVWEAVLVPSGTPGAIVERLHREIAAIITLPEIGVRLVEFGFMPSTSTSEEAADVARVESARWAMVIQAAGIKAE